MAPRWTRINPVCAAQKILDKMFTDGKISRDSTAAAVYKLDPEFSKYTLDVFRNKFNETQNRNGLELKRPSEDDNEFGSAFFSNSQAKRNKSNTESHIEDEVSADSNIMHNNQPILMEVFRDPDTEKDKVIVVASLVGGTTDVEFTLLGSGPGTTFAQISYKWAPNSFNIEELFAKEIKTGKIPFCHPKIVQLKKGLQNYRDSKDDTPIGTIDLTLPIPVLTTENSISRSGRKNKDGTMIMIIELTAYESLYSVKPETKKVLFDLETESETEQK